jgi:Zn-dependent M16 (insulinase) family peptidase
MAFFIVASTTAFFRSSASTTTMAFRVGGTSGIGGGGGGGMAAGTARRSLANTVAMSYLTSSSSSSSNSSLRRHGSIGSIGGGGWNGNDKLFWGRTFVASSSSSSSTCPSTTTTTALKSTLEESTTSTTTTPAAEVPIVEHPAYTILSTDTISEFGAHATLYRHNKSGAQLLSLSTDDDNKCFGITFRTPPSDSTGVPHILEHSVLCGSRKYTTKDPFVQLLQGSLQTFLNAFTYPDRTCYVVASQNTKDFYNLINVYSDAVFHPRAINDPMVHAQEGWHLELEKLEDALTYKGVVYNEMKGVYSSPESLLQREAQQSLFPDNTYGVDSGGDPTVIPQLSFEQFAQFHGKFYHPSNARIFFAGEDDVYQRLEIMEEYLSEFEDIQSGPESKIEWQAKRYEAPVKVRYPYPVSDKSGGDGEGGGVQKENDEEGGGDTHYTMVNWLMNDRPFTPMEEITVTVLDHLLMGTSSSILRKTLMESGLGDSITGGGLSDELLQATYSVGLKGVKPANVDTVEQLILDTLDQVATNGFEADDIASSMNTIEFQMREFNTGSFPKGLSLMLGSMSKWIYDRDPTEALKFEEPLAELKARIAKDGSKVFQEMIMELLLKNSHRTTVEMYPSKTLEEEQLQVSSLQRWKIDSLCMFMPSSFSSRFYRTNIQHNKYAIIGGERSSCQNQRVTYRRRSPIHHR